MGLYIVRKDSWYSERAVWGIAGAVILAGTLLAWQVHPAWMLLVGGTGLFALLTAFSGYCVMSTALVNLGFEPRLGDVVETGSGLKLYRMRTDKWFLERGIYLVVGTTQTVGSILAVVQSPWWLAFTGFVGAMSIGFAWSGFCPVANFLYFLGFEPRLAPTCSVASQAPREAVAAK
jgi:hypothetical protein